LSYRASPNQQPESSYRLYQLHRYRYNILRYPTKRIDNVFSRYKDKKFLKIQTKIGSLLGMKSPRSQQLRRKTERKIAQILTVGTGTIHRDLVYLNKQAQDSLKTYVQERLPEQYQKYINELNRVLKIG